MSEPGDTPPAPSVLTRDEQLVADEVARLRTFAGHPDGRLRLLQADMLEQVSTALAVEFLRELALRAIARLDGDPWMISAVIQAEVHRELRQGLRRVSKSFLSGPPT